MAKQIIKTNTVGLGCCCCFQKQETGYVFVLCFFPRCCLGMPVSLSPNCHWPPALSSCAPLHPPRLFGRLPSLLRGQLHNHPVIAQNPALRFSLFSLKSIKSYLQNHVLMQEDIHFLFYFEL